MLTLERHILSHILTIFMLSCPHNEWIEIMYRADVIYHAPPGNQYQSACFEVPKKDGTMRIVVDMRKDNLKMEEDFVSSRPVIYMLGDIQASGSKVFSSVMGNMHFSLFT